MTDDRIIWAAGFFDGEGCIHIGQRPGRKAGQLQLQINVQQKVREPLDVLVDLFGGGVYVSRWKSGDGWQWHVFGPTAARALEAMQPYLVVKQQAADEAILFQQMKTQRELVP